MKITYLLPLFLLLMCLPELATGQQNNFSYQPINRPAGQNWQQYKTEHFRVIFPEGSDSLANRAANILEQHYTAASELTGGSLHNFPVILKTENDLSNGFVTSFNFRSEVDVTPQKGKGMNPKTGDWLRSVLPHELVHATHFNVQQTRSEQKISIPNFISLFAPDIARSVHGFVPVGLHEGLAVYYESEEVTPEGGRGNYTFTLNNFNANFSSPYRWNMGQTLIPSDYTHPTDRHYLAGYTFVDWLHDNYGDSVTKNAIRKHYSHFFLGYGYALRKATGYWPGKLFDRYEESLEEQAEERLSKIPVNTTERSEIIDLPFKGEQARGPKWLSDSELIFYGTFYNGKMGFYRYNVNTKKFSLVHEAFAVADYNYEVDSEYFYFSSYHRNPLYRGVYKADLHKLKLSSGKTSQITKNARVFAPTTGAGKTLAIQFKENAHHIVEVLEDGSLRMLKQFEKTNPISLKINPKDERVAVILNRNGIQGLWLTTGSTLKVDLDDEPDFAFRDGSIHDVEWHPNGEKLLFTMDAAPAMNVYELDLQSEQITQITSSLFNAFEASYAPDGSSITYVVQTAGEQNIAILDTADFLNKPVSVEELLTNEELQEQLDESLTDQQAEENFQWEKEKYRAGLSWLKPRIVFPVYRDNAGSPQFGPGFSSTDALSGQSYYAEITGIQNKLWYNLTYNNKTFFPGFEMNAYSEPDFFALRDRNQQEIGVMQQSRGLSLSLPLTYTFRGDTRLSSLFIDPEVSAEQLKYYNLSPTEISDFATRYKAGVFSQLSLGILSLPRDVQPSAGLSAFGLFEHSLNEASLTIDSPNHPALNGEQIYGKQWTAYYGVFTYLSPLQRFNQSLRLDIRFLQQSESPIYSNSTIVPMGFSDDPFRSIAFTHLGRISTRYTVPLFYPDKGGLTVPLYLSSIYLTGFSHTLTDMESEDLLASSRSIFGAGFHVQFKLSNVQFDFGVGFAFEPTRKNSQLIFGQF